MSDITVRLLAEEDWEVYRTIRLSALRENPEAFVATFAEEEHLPEAEWRAKMNRSDRLVAERDNEVIGVVSLLPGPLPKSSDEVDHLNAAEVFGLWVTPAARGSGAPELLVDAAAQRARAGDFSHLVYWAGVDNGRAVAFASGYGFRPTDSRRPARTAGEHGGAEAALVFPLAR